MKRFVESIILNLSFKKVLLNVFIPICSFVQLYSQEINPGLYAGLFSDKKNVYYSIGGSFEYRSSDPHASFNIDPFVTFIEDGKVITLPIYMKVMFGEKFRFSPAIGGLLSSNRRYGYLFGLHLEYVIKNRFILFSKNEYYIYIWKETYYNHFGGSNKYTTQEDFVQFSLGIKMMFKK